MPVLLPTLCLDHSILQACAAPRPPPPPPLTCPVIVPVPASALLPSPAFTLPSTSFVEITSASALERKEEEKEAAQGPGGLARHRPLSRPCSQERLGPLGRIMLPGCWLLREALWAARPGLAVAPWDSLAHSGG